MTPFKVVTGVGSFVCRRDQEDHVKRQCGVRLVSKWFSNQARRQGMSPRTKEEGMYRFKLLVLTCATAATLLLALGAAGTAGADPRANYCDGQGLWAASFFSAGISNGAVFFDIFNQAPPAPSDDDGSEEFALASQLAAQVALGLGNAGEGDKYHFRFETVLVAGGATARGHGFLFVREPTALPTATFVVAGKGDGHPVGGSFKLSGGGDVTCVAEEATVADAQDVVVEYENGMTDDVFVNMARCPDPEECSPPGD
jgi:hypothetical protein